MDHWQVLPALGTALGDSAVAEEEIVEVDQHRGIVEDDGQGHPIEGVAGDFSEQERPPFIRIFGCSASNILCCLAVTKITSNGVNQSRTGRVEL